MRPPPSRHLLFALLAGLWLVSGEVAPGQAGGSGVPVRVQAIVIPDRQKAKPTASGENYDPQERTAAHQTLPFGSVAWVTNPANQRSVLVRINDRVPAKEKGHELALSSSAASFIGLSGSGTFTLQLTPIALILQAPPPQATEEYAIAVATYSDLLRAIYRQMGLERNGVSGVKIQRLIRDGGLHYRVIIGGFPSPDAANTAATSLEARKLIEAK